MGARRWAAGGAGALRYAAAAAAAALAAWSIVPALRLLLATRHLPPAWGRDLDCALIHAGLERTPHAVDTLRWWTGPWVAGPEVPFYRPLSSLLFWLEWKAWGAADWLYALPGMAAHAGALLLFSLFAARLARRGDLAAPAAAGLVFALLFAGALDPYRARVAALVLHQWKNQPDAFAAVCTAAALSFYLAAQEGRRGALPGAAACYLAACLFKEVAVLLPAVTCSLESRLDAGARRRAAAMGGACGFYMAARWLALGDWGYTYGSNEAWWGRTLLHLLGPFHEAALPGGWLGCALALLLYGCRLAWPRGARATRSRWMAAGGAAGTAGLLGAAADPTGGSGWPEGVLRCLEPAVLGTVGGILLFLAAAHVLLRRCPALLPVGFVWTAAFLLPLAFSPGPVHRYYLSQGGYHLLHALAAAAIAPAGRARRGASALSPWERGKLERKPAQEGASHATART